MLARGALLILAVPWLPACSSDIESHRGKPIGACNTVQTSYENGTRTHIDECSDVEYEMSPPVFGDHYPFWAAFKTYDHPVPDGYLVHSLEHGGVIYFYDCADGCSDEVSEVQAFIDELPVDPLCSEDVKRRVILVPRPNLGARWAAAAWGFSLTADCFDRELFQRFYEQHSAQAPENLCNQGIELTADACQ